MKKLVIASIAILLTTSAAHGWGLFGRRGNCGGCPRMAARACAPAACATPCAEVCEPTPPRCTKTVMVDRVIKVPQTVEVAPRRIETPVPDRVVYVEQPCKYRRIPQPAIPQPDLIEEVPQPCLVKRIPQRPEVRYECPTDCDNGCETPC